jgi:hypothetical protein
VRKRLNSSSPRKIQTDMTQFTGYQADNKSSPARSYAQATSNRYEALSDEDEIEDTTMEDASSSDDSETSPVQDNAKATGMKKAGTQKLPANPLSKKSQRKAAQDLKKKDKIVQSVNLSSATIATLERAKKAKELLQKSAENHKTVNTDSVQETITEDNTSQEISNEDQVDTTPLFNEPNKGDEQTDTSSTSSEDSNNESPTRNSPSNNTPTTTERPNASGQRVNNPYEKSKKTQKQGILHAIPQPQPNLKPSRNPGL